MSVDLPSSLPSSALLGEVVSWDMKATEVNYAAVQDAVQDALRDAGLDPDEARDMTPQSAFSRACRSMKEERTIDKLDVDKGVIRFQFTKKHLAGERLDFDYECTVRLDSSTGDIECHENTILEQHARELFAHAMQTRNANDVTLIIKRLFKENADLYAINKRGFAYFVPECHRPFTAKVDAFLLSLGGQLARFPVPKGTPEGNASVKDAVQHGLSGLLGELTAAVEGWDETTRPATMKKALERWEKIQFKADAYAEYLGSEQERLLESLAVAKQDLQRRILELKPEGSEGAETADEEELATA